MSNDTQPEIRFPGFTEDWEQRKLGEVVESVGTGRSTFTNGIVQTSETPYAVLGSTSVISYDSMFDHSGDFILTARVGANAGNLYKYFGEVKISDNTVYIQANNLDFIYYLLTKYDLKRLSFGTGQPLVKASEVKNLKLNFPQKNEEQQKIGSFFKQLDDTIALHQRKLDLLKETKKGFLQKMFPKNGAKVPEIRFPGFTEDWEARKLIDYLDVSTQKNKDEIYDKGDVLSVSGDCGIVNQIEFQGRSFAGVSVANYGVVETGDIVYTKSPLKANPYGIIKTNKGKTGIVSTLYAVYKPKQITDPEFVQIYFEQDVRMNNYMRPLVNKGAKNDMKVSDENALKGEVMFPKLEEQRKISSYFEQLNNLITLHQRELDLLKETKKGFLQKMFV